MSGIQDLGARAIQGGRLILLSIGLLVLRLAFGGSMLVAHGWGKLQMLTSGKADTFGDPLGLGPSVTLMLAVFAEFVCSVLIVLGLATRLAALPLIATMATAFFVVHAADPFQRKELALVYLAAFLALAFTGPGRYSLDALIAERWRRKRS